MDVPRPLHRIQDDLAAGNGNLIQAAASEFVRDVTAYLWLATQFAAYCAIRDAELRP